MNIADRIHALPGATVCRLSPALQVAEAELTRKRKAASDAADAERNVIAKYQAGDAREADVWRAESEAKEASEEVGAAWRALAEKRLDHSKKHLANLAPTAAEMSDIMAAISSQVDGLRVRAAGIMEWCEIHGLPTPRVIGHAARLGDVVRRLRHID